MLGSIKPEKKHIYFWERLSFRILAGFFVPLAVCIYVLYSISSSFIDMREQREKSQTTWSMVRSAESRVLLNINRTKFSVNEMWNPEQGERKLTNEIKATQIDITRIREGSAGEEASQKNLEFIEKSFKDISVLVEDMQDSVRRGDRTTWETQRNNFNTNVSAIEKSLEKLGALHELAEVKDLDVLSATEKDFIARLYYIIGAVAVFGLGLSIFVTFSITLPVQQLIRRLQDIATGEGDLTKRIDTRFSTGEMKEMAGWTNLFLDKTQSIIATIANAAKTIRRTTEQVSGFTHTSTVMAVSINKNMMAQSMNIEECSSSLGSIDDLLQASSDSSKQAASLSKIAMDRALQGGASVNETIEAMEKIEESAEKVEVLISSINDFAAQTNLLAINAAIEASKAGEHGKGFAVVAEEVRKLAERTRKLTGQVTGLITESNSRVKTGVSLAKNAGVALEGIIKDVEAVSSLIQRIAASSTKQTESSTQLVSGMQLVTNGIRENLKQMHQVNQSVEFSSAEVQRLDALVNELNTIVGQFKLEAEQNSAPVTVAFHDGDGSRSISNFDPNEFKSQNIPPVAPMANEIEDGIEEHEDVA